MFLDLVLLMFGGVLAPLLLVEIPLLDSIALIGSASPFALRRVPFFLSVPVPVQHGRSERRRLVCRHTEQSNARFAT